MSPSSASASRSINALTSTSNNERGKKRSLEGDDVERQKDEKRQKEESPSRLFSTVVVSSVLDHQIASHQESSPQSRINSFFTNSPFNSLEDLQEEFINIIKDFNNKGLLTHELLTSASPDGPHKGVNVVWCLAYFQQWDILISVNNKNLLTKELLAFTAQDEPYKNINIVWLLVFHKQWEILKSLNDRNLLNKELLASKPQIGHNKGKNVVWFLAYFGLWDTLKSLDEKSLLTQELLASTVQDGRNKGINVVWILANCQQWDILASLNNKNLLNSIHFETRFDNNRNALEELFRAAIEAQNLNPSKLDFINKLLLKIEEIDKYTLLMLNRYLKLVLKKEKNTPVTEQVYYSDSEKNFLITLRKKVPVWIKAPQPEKNIFCALFPPGKEEYPEAYSIVTSYQLTEDALLEIPTTPELPNVLIDLIQEYKGY